MPLIATLVSHPEGRAVSATLANMASRSVGASAVRWLAEDIACDLVLPEKADAGEAAAALRAALASHPVDVIVQPTEGRRKKILIADMDSTMIDQECIDELADEIGVKDRVAAITARSMNGEIAFEPALRERVALLNGLDTAVVDRLIENRLTLASGGLALVRTMRGNGAWTALVSGGFNVFTSRIAAMLGFQENRANRLIEEHGRFTGLVAEPILGRAAKAEALLEISARLGLTPADALAVGDGANDLDMIRLAGTGVALHAKPSVAAEAKVRIDHGDLTALLYLQGYRQEEFAG
ncbi:MAG: phosphoserine phosphatase SerB [Mesorhizobium sp.]|uniref:phosphoserine phosphatase SerB n=2 Tax=Mesorhizobium TaxID=68287 RepID=UPI000FCC44D6|nr:MULTISPECIES: phosphoserine phosphatase SerB [unclassified Mesorhizobium]RUX41026.1 phosphoserine phosphatase SerB [Mesorhizobium sp. M4A.F.Ca.ET.050.02.1.1]RVD42422.1 phosphoserine phosphatase SerB [Mesorhizobium sp. M4A.F.Ca.ET.020.02.1.1]RWC14735.1 MAG: phosphoserine phosphatase SerB [Mesorhizobium sp.]RWD02354.1 MAG: phosphoserine phosphatase SerB [Mesorhizobium sp.]RWD20959.1 MAG: phosphoserine phosphatase SerB [Mesorhizobium sp.]